ncbi:MAG: asparagine synthase (glutamine-hydrolyzing) [Candidatus Nealsonbacteria bacterium RIFCSPLOWO2_02_39_8]|uniref:asparagine synthase (glutamine-hydrolyzing) n=1 Tax=Candidatus Nealsonbacteria bacterium RIFCSPLOWO2_02_39_8 TaxID=1801674 RepID=A0A1G2EHT8_9BACT|nr:MAG: asparagine synthase (glutamine-hydrolyzing) [Candidatus Nealsonbacteria bacterium RIFCSPLOWO2_02_39_8]
MCGIVGIWDFRQGSDKISKGLIESMRDALAHRGPDDAGIFIDEKYNLAFGHRRLSIIDLSARGHQPMANDSRELWITYNGEIYNYKEIRSELVFLGCKFKSDSDTEVALKAYEKWGIKSVRKLNGMFAFAIWDKRREKIFLFRDRAGVKPLYYYFKDGLFLFASELKAFHKHPDFKKEINPDGLALFLQLGYIPAPYVIFRNTYKLLPGHYLEIDRNKDFKETRYWDIMDYYSGKQMDKSEEEVEKELEAVLIKSFKSRMVADVPVGVFLSGGIDSSVVAAILQSHSSDKLKTFTIGFNESGYNEAPYAKKIARHLGADHHEFYCDWKDAFNIIPNLPEIYDEPFGDSSGIPTYLVSKIAREKVKVSLSADGGDELFCGYPYYWKIGSIYRKLRKIPKPLLSFSASVLSLIPQEFAETVYNIFLSKDKDAKEKFLKLKEILRQKELGNIFKIIISYWQEEEIKKLLKIKYDSCDIFSNEFARAMDLENISQMQSVDFKTYLCDDILTKVDRATMAAGLEGRDPFLDRDIIEYAAKLPLKFKYRNGESKYILRKILYKYIPKELLERPKQGFGIPIHKWLREDCQGLLKQYLSYSRIKEQGIFNEEYVKRYLENYLQGRSNNGHKIWFLLMFQLWYERWM